MREIVCAMLARHCRVMRRMAMFFVLAISLVGAIALWPEDRSYASAERMAAPLALELVETSTRREALRARLDSDPLIETVAIWRADGQLSPPVSPHEPRYTLTPQRLRALEALLAGRVMPVWARAPFAESDAVVRCQRGPDICIIFAAQPLAQVLDFPPSRLIRPLQGNYALGPALLLILLATGSGLALLWRQMQRRKRSAPLR